MFQTTLSFLYSSFLKFQINCIHLQKFIFSMKKILTLLFIALLLSFSSCRNDFQFEPSKGGLTFSKDTVYLDTVFTNIGSSTYRLKVYNKSDSDISIPKIQLGKGASSKYRMMIDGLTGQDADNSGFGEGKIFNDVELLAKDSMFIFVEVTADVASANPTDFLYTDQIEFHNISGAPQTVELVTLIQDAVFIYPNRPIDTGIKETLTINGMNSEIEGHELTTTDELHWTNEKPYVVYGYGFVPDSKTLTIDAGAKVHFHANSGLIVDKNAKLLINGTLDNEVVFEGDRLEPDFSDVPGQWGTILITSNLDNQINHLTLKNATVGLLLQRSEETIFPKLTISNSQIYDCSNIGLLARTATVTGHNLVINNAGQATLACTYGGTYNFSHCTFNNNWSSSNQVAVLISNNFETTDAIFVQDLVEANFNNCIIYGGNQIEMLLNNKQTETVTTLFNYKFNHCLIRFNNISNQFTENPLYQFDTDVTHYSNCSIATNSITFKPKFEDQKTNKLWLTEGLNLPFDALATAAFPKDILNIDRTSLTDLGAYQFVP